MHLRWLSDFIAVAELGSFSKAANARAITQPVMSRHIKQLEDWMGVPLFSRDTFPVTLTPAGNQFFKLASAMVESLEQGKNHIAQEYSQQQRHLKFVMQHALAAEFFAKWWAQKTADHPNIHIKVDARNLPHCVQQLENKQSDILICFTHPAVPLFLDGEMYIGKKIGEETMQAVCGVRNSKLLYSLTKRGNRPLPLVSSGPDDFMGRIVSGIINRNKVTKHFLRVYEDSFSEGVRAQVLAGLGIGWLPSSLIQEDIKSGRLALLGGESWQERLDITLYRRREFEHPVIEAISV